MQMYGDLYVAHSEASESLYGSLFTLSTQFIKPNYLIISNILVILPTDTAP